MLSDYRALDLLTHSPDHELRITELANRLGLKQSSATRLVERLEDKDLVFRDTCPEDGRGVYAVVTEQASPPRDPRGGLPFVGIIVRDGQALSGFGVNRVQETWDPTAHAEIIALREAVASHGRRGLIGATLLATGEPCGMCYRHAIAHGITDVQVAIDREEAPSPRPSGWPTSSPAWSGPSSQTVRTLIAVRFHRCDDCQPHRFHPAARPNARQLSTVCLSWTLFACLKSNCLPNWAGNSEQDRHLRSKTGGPGEARLLPPQHHDQSALFHHARRG